MTVHQERESLRLQLAALLDVAGVEVPIKEISGKLNIRELRGLIYRVERAMADSYAEGYARGTVAGGSDPEDA
jgi:hypothetical protein